MKGAKKIRWEYPHHFSPRALEYTIFDVYIYTRIFIDQGNTFFPIDLKMARRHCGDMEKLKKKWFDNFAELMVREQKNNTNSYVRILFVSIIIFARRSGKECTERIDCDRTTSGTRYKLLLLLFFYSLIAKARANDNFKSKKTVIMYYSNVYTFIKNIVFALHCNLWILFADWKHIHYAQMEYYCFRCSR